MPERPASVNYTPYPTQEVGGGGGTPMGVRATPEDFGSQVGGAVEKAGGEAFQVAQKLQENANHVAVNDMIVNGYAPEVNNLVSNFKKLTGTDATLQQPQYEKSLQDINAKYLAQGNQQVKEYMGQYVTRHTLFSMDAMSNHADSQYVQHEHVVQEQSMKNAQDEAMNNWQNPEAVDFNVNRSIGLSTLNYGNKIGHDSQSQPIVEQMAKEDGSKVAASAIDMAIDNRDYAKANAYKTKYNDLLSGQQKLSIEKKLQDVNISNNAANISDNLLTGKPLVPEGTQLHQNIQAKADLADLAHKNNFDPNIAFALRATESGGGISAGSSRKDAFQTGTKLRDKGFEGDDLESSAHNGFKIWNANSSDLQQRLGRPLSPSEGYLAYNQGGLGAETLLNAKPTQTAVQALSTIMSPDDARRHVVDNGGTVTMSAKDFSQHVQDMFQTHYDAQKVSNTSPDAIRAQTNVQLPSVQQTSNPHELFNQINDRLPSAQAAAENITDDKLRESVQKQIKLKYEQAKLGDTAWKNQQAEIVQQYADNPRYTSMDEIPESVKSNLRASGQLSAMEKVFNDKNNPRAKDNTYGASFLRTAERLISDDPTDAIKTKAGLQQEYGDNEGLHSSGFKQLQTLQKNVSTPEGKAQLVNQVQYLNDLRQKMAPGAEGDAQFEKALPLFFSSYNSAIAEKKDTSGLLSFDPKNKDSFASQIKLPTPAELTSKKIDNSVGWIQKWFGSTPVNTALTAQEKVLADYQSGKITEEQKNQQLAGLGVALSAHAPRPE